MSLAHVMAALASAATPFHRGAQRSKARSTATLKAQHAWTPRRGPDGVWRLPGRTKRAVQSIPGPGWRYYRSRVRHAGGAR